MKIKPIIEELKDIPKENKIVHGTNILSLIKILKSGELKGNVYSVPASNKKEERKEIATARVSIPKDEFKKVSGGVGSINFILYKDRIKAGVKGAKIKPIAELPKSAQEEAVNVLNKIDFLKQDPKTFLNNILKYIQKKWSGKELEEIRELSRRFMLNRKYTKDEYHYLFDRYNFLSILVNFFKQREYEERIIADSIPLDSRFMEIEIQKDFLEDPNPDLVTRKNIKENKTLFQKYKNLFTDNKAKEKLFTLLDN